jgi:hypothetical protein
VVNAPTDPESASSPASCGPVSSPDSGTAQPPARTMPNTASSISTRLPIITATRSPRARPAPSSACAMRLMFASKSPQLRRTSPQTTASLRGWKRAWFAITSGMKTWGSSRGSFMA